MKKQFALALALASAPFATMASDLSYTWIEGDFAFAELEGTNETATGFGIRGSVEIGESNFYVLGGYQHAQAEIDTPFGEFDVEADGAELGLGYALPVSDRADVLFEAAASRVDVEGEAENFYRLSVGARGAFSDALEGWVRVNYTDITTDFTDEFNDEGITVTPGLQYRFNEMWGAVAEIDLGEGGQSYLVGVRASF